MKINKDIVSLLVIFALQFVMLILTAVAFINVETIEKGKPIRVKDSVKRSPVLISRLLQEV